MMYWYLKPKHVRSELRDSIIYFRDYNMINIWDIRRCIILLHRILNSIILIKIQYFSFYLLENVILCFGDFSIVVYFFLFVTTTCF